MPEREAGRNRLASVGELASIALLLPAWRGIVCCVAVPLNLLLVRDLVRKPVPVFGIVR